MRYVEGINLEKLYEIDLLYQKIDNPSLRSFKLKCKHRKIIVLVKQTLCQFAEYLVRNSMNSQLRNRSEEN